MAQRIYHPDPRETQPRSFTHLIAIAIAAVIVALLVAMAFLPGCTSEQIVESRAALARTEQSLTVAQQELDRQKAARDEALAALKAVQAEMEATKSAIEAAKAEGKSTASAEAALAALSKQVEAMAAAVAKVEKPIALLETTLSQGKDAVTKLRQVVDSANDTADLIEQGGKVGAGYAGPYAPMVVLATGLLAALLRARQNRQAAQDIAYAIEVNKTPQGTVNFADEATKKSLRTEMGARATALVDEARGLRKSLLPI